MITPEWVSIAAPFVSGAFGVGIAWGVMRQKIHEHDRRVQRIEDKLEIQVGSSRCDQMRAECRVNITEAIRDLRIEISKVRDLIISANITGMKGRRED
jgi:hypothetical protein